MFFERMWPLIIIVVVIAVSYYGYKWIRWTAWKENRREQLREALFHIEDVLDEARGIPNIDTAKLKKAKEKIDELLKEAQKV